MTTNTEKVGTLVFACLLMALGLFVGFETLNMSEGPAYAVVGPRAFPAAIGIGLVLVACGLLWELYAQKRAAVATEDPYDWQAIAWVLGGLLCLIVALLDIGWVPAATALFVVVARAFGERRWFLSGAIGLFLAVLTFVAFNHVLGLQLPHGLFLAALQPGA